jgi:iron(III) transport system substrate-binding protein
MHKWLRSALTALVWSLVPIVGAVAADLPKATQKMLADGKLNASLLDGLDAELAVPKAWLDGAAAEKQVDIFGTWNDADFRTMTAAFRERYPFVNLRYSRTGTTGRGMKVMVALREGRVIADVLTSIADATFELIEMKALADLRELPGFANVSSDYVATDGTWASYKLSYRCMAYNTNKVKKEDLPATWDDLVASPRWRGGNLAVSNLPDSWLLVLWGGKGEAWGADFTRKLFEQVRPQRRKEGMNATVSLTVAGEADANLPAGEDRVLQNLRKGAPIGYHCISPVTITVSQIAMLEKSPHKNGARLFINWMLSREGQIQQYVEASAVPVHKGLQTPTFLPFADTIIGKPHLVRDDALLNSATNKKMQDLWNTLWASPVAGQKGP